MVRTISQKIPDLRQTSVRLELSLSATRKEAADRKTSLEVHSLDPGFFLNSLCNWRWFDSLTPKKLGAPIGWEHGLLNSQGWLDVFFSGPLMALKERGTRRHLPQMGNFLEDAVAIPNWSINT